jgi:hypothetical protein
MLALTCSWLLSLRIMAAEGHTFTAREGFQIVLPDGWQQMPESLLSETIGLGQTIPLLQGDKKVEYGFYPVADTDDVGFPRILVVIDRIGRVSDTEMSSLAEGLQESITRVFEQHRFTNISPASMRMSLDAKNRLLWVHTASASSILEGQPVSGMMAVYFTDIGTVSFVASSRQKDYPFFEPIFADIIRSVAFPRETLPSASAENSNANGGTTRWIVKWGVIILGFVLYGAYKEIKPILAARAAERARKDAPGPDTMVRSKCEHCGSQISYPLSLDGSLLECPACGKQTKVNF